MKPFHGHEKLQVYGHRVKCTRPRGVGKSHQSDLLLRDIYHKGIVHSLITAFYRPQTKLREGNVFTPVCDSVQGGGCIQACSGQGCTSHRQIPHGKTPPRHTPPWADIPGQTFPGRHPPSPRRALKRAVRILLECILFRIVESSDVCQCNVRSNPTIDTSG